MIEFTYFDIMQSSLIFFLLHGNFPKSDLHASHFLPPQSLSLSKYTSLLYTHVVDVVDMITPMVVEYSCVHALDITTQYLIN